MSVSPAQQIAGSEHVALVERKHPAAAYEVVATIRGEPVTGAIDLSVPTDSTTLLVVRPTPFAPWRVVGPVSRDRADVLRKIVDTMPGEGASAAQWEAHVALVFPYLNDSAPLIRDIATGELDRAPYAALRTLKPQLDAARYATLFEGLTDQALFTLLYGIASRDAAPIERRIEAARRANEATNLAALLAADLEIRGPSRVAWIEKHYLADRDRTLPEIQAALLALSVQGGANAVIPRTRVIAAYRVFMKEHNAMAGWVVPDFVAWGYWDAGPEYARLLKTGTLRDPASRVAAFNYLMQSPRAADRSAARAIAAGGKI